MLQVDIHPAATLGKGLMIDHATGLLATADVIVEDEVSILHNVSIGVPDRAGPTRIGWGSSIGAGSKILSSVVVGPCVRIAAGSVLNASVAGNRTVAGSPARIVATAPCPEATRSFDELLATKLEPMCGRHQRLPIERRP